MTKFLWSRTKSLLPLGFIFVCCKVLRLTLGRKHVWALHFDYQCLQSTRFQNMYWSLFHLCFVSTKQLKVARQSWSLRYRHERFWKHPIYLCGKTSATLTASSVSRLDRRTKKYLLLDHLPHLYERNAAVAVTGHLERRECGQGALFPEPLV